MPIKPGKNESQSDWISRCASEMTDAHPDWENDRVIAACHSMWRDKDKESPMDKISRSDPEDDVIEPDDDESYADFMERCQNEGGDEDSCDTWWEQSKAASGIVHKTHAGEINGGEYVLSDETPDRMGDVIELAGWELTAFKANPIALFGHRSDFVVGRWRNVGINKDTKQLRGHLELAPKGSSARIDEIRALVEAGILRAVSVGFKPIDSAPLNHKDPFGGSRYSKQELVECSLVAVPANPNALSVAKSLKISDDTQRLVFAKHGNGSRTITREVVPGKQANISLSRKGATMSLAQQITDMQTYIAAKQAELEEAISAEEMDVEKTEALDKQLTEAKKKHAVMISVEKNIAGTIKPNGGTPASRALATTSMSSTQESRDGVTAPIIMKSRKKEWDSIDLLVHAGASLIAAKNWGVSIDAARLKIYGDDEQTKVVTDWVCRAPSAPAMTTVAGWAQELVHQIYADLMGLLFAKSIFPRLSAKGLTLSFGQAGKIVMPTRSRTPSLAGSFVGEGMAIPVRQGAFTVSNIHAEKAGSHFRIYARNE